MFFVAEGGKTIYTYIFLQTVFSMLQHRNFLIRSTQSQGTHFQYFENIQKVSLFYLLFLLNCFPTFSDIRATSCEGERGGAWGEGWYLHVSLVFSEYFSFFNHVLVEC